MYRTVDTATWGDPWFEELAPLSKFLFLYLITNARTTSCGAYPITLRTISNETCLDRETITVLLESLGDRVRWWPDDHYIFVRNFYRYQRASSSDKFRIGAAKQTIDLPPDVRDAVWEVYPELRMAPEPSAYPTDTLSIPSAYPTDTLSTVEDRLSTEQNITDTEQTTTQQRDNAPDDAPVPMKKRGTRIPFTFGVSEEMYAWAEGKGVTRAEADRVTEQFILYWQAETGRHAVKMDWNKTWQNRILDQIEQGKIGPARRNGIRPSSRMTQADINAAGQRNPDGTLRVVL